MGLVWSGYMDTMWNDTCQTLWQLNFRGCFRAFCARVETHNFGFVSAELHPRLFTPKSDICLSSSRASVEIRHRSST